MKKFSLAARLGAATFAFLAACAGGFSPSARAQSFSPAAKAQFAHQLRALNDFQASLSPSQRKLPSSLLLSTPQAAQTRAYLPRLRGARTLASVSQKQSVLIYGEMTPRIKAAIEREGTLTGFFPASGVASAQLSTVALEHIAAATEIKSVRINPGPYVKRSTRPMSDASAVARALGAATRGNTGATVTEGDKTHQADQARDTYKATGKGIKVGVISDSSESFKALQQAGELPPDATILAGQAGKGASEGTAMMEIIHDLAPDAGLEFSTCGDSPDQMAKNILALQKDGCKIIVDDIGFPSESVYQEDVVSAAIRQVSAQGVIYLTAIGNDGNKKFSDPRRTDTGIWDGYFVDGVQLPASTFSATGTGTGNVILNDWNSRKSDRNPITNGSNSTSALLWWADPVGKSANDYNLYNVDPTGQIVDASMDKQDGQGFPAEFLNGGVVGGNALVVTRPVNSKLLPIRLFIFAPGASPTLGYSVGPTGYGHGVSEFALSVGASPANAGAGGPYPGPFTKDSKLEYFSSTGPRTLFFTPEGTPESRKILKPDIVAADGVMCATPDFNPFYGTSAAAPHAAAIAALAWSAQPTASAAQIKERMIKGVIDIGTPGFEDDSGNGIVMAPLVLKYTDPTPTPTPGGPTPTPTPSGTPQPTPTGTPTATGTPQPTGTATPTPKPTATPKPTPVPTSVPGAIGFAEATYKIGEGGGRALISVKRFVTNGQGASGAVSVKYQTTTGGTATAGADYQTVSGTLSWASGDTKTKTFAVPIVDDTFREPDETVFLRLYDVVGKGTLSTTRRTTTLTILDNDKSGESIPPSVAITSPLDGARVSNVERITGTASDTGGSGLYSVSLLIQRPSDGAYWDGSAWGTAPVLLPTTLSGGNWARTSGNPPRSALVDDFLRITAVAFDGAGNTSRVSALVFVDPTPPQVVIFTPAQGAKLSALQSATGIVSDASGDSTLFVFLRRASDGKYWTGTGDTWSATPTPLPVDLADSGEWSRSLWPKLAGGNYTLSARGTDEVGNTATDATTFTVPSTSPPSGGGA